MERNIYKNKFAFLCTITVLSIVIIAFVNSATQGSKEKSNKLVTKNSPEASLKKFRNLKYGAFIHWTPTTQIGEEVSFSRNVAIPASAYDRLYTTFDPTEFDAEEWVKILKEAGFRYLVFVPKHHDGFNMWDTKFSDYNIMHSPLGRDVMKEISDACKKYDLPLCLYYSIADFYQPDCVPYGYQFGPDFGGPGYKLPEGQKPDYDRYVTYMKAQLKELTENYGPFLGWWFDGGWQKTWTKERGIDLFNYMRELQPNVLMSHRVGTAYNDSVYLPTWFPNEKERVGDYAVLEVDMPKFNRDIPWEYTRPANGKSYSWTQNEYTDISIWIDDLVKSACGDGNFILGVSGTPKGRFEPKLIDKFRQMGSWLKQYGESIFETRGGPYKRTTLYGSTCKANKIYLHVFKTDTNIVLPPLSRKIITSRMLNGGKVNVTQTDKGITVKIGKYDFQTPTTIVVLELDGSTDDITPIDGIPVNRGVLVKSSNGSRSNDRLSADGDISTAWKAIGNVEQPWLEYDLGKERSISRAILQEGMEEGQYNNIRIAQLQVKTDTGWQTVREISAWGYGSSKYDEWPISVSVPEIRFNPITTRYLRLLITRHTGNPVIHEFEVYER